MRPHPLHWTVAPSKLVLAWEREGSLTVLIYSETFDKLTDTHSVNFTDILSAIVWCLYSVFWLRKMWTVQMYYTGWFFYKLSEVVDTTVTEFCKHLLYDSH